MSVNFTTPEAQRLSAFLCDLINAQSEWIDEDKFQIKDHKKYAVASSKQKKSEMMQPYFTALRKDRVVLNSLAELQTTLKRQLGNPPKFSEFGLMHMNKPAKNLLNPLPHDYQLDN